MPEGLSGFIVASTLVLIADARAKGHTRPIIVPCTSAMPWDAETDVTDMGFTVLGTNVPRVDALRKSRSCPTTASCMTTKHT